MTRTVRSSDRRLALPLTLSLLVLLGGLTACAGPQTEEAATTAEDPTPASNDEQPTPPSGDEGYRNTVKWTTASEVDNFGFDVYRGDTREGPFTKLTDESIAGAGTTDEPTKYSFVDDTIDPTRSYFYYVEAISMDNRRSRFTPVFEAKPKLPQPGDGEPTGGSEAGTEAATGTP